MAIDNPVTVEKALEAGDHQAVQEGRLNYRERMRAILFYAPFLEIPSYQIPQIVRHVSVIPLMNDIQNRFIHLYTHPAG